MACAGIDGHSSCAGPLWALRNDITRRIELEIGFGLTSIVLHRARLDAATYFVAIDHSGYCCRKLRGARGAMHNLAIVHEDALTFLSERTPSGRLDAVHIYFPAPFPSKQRLITGAFELELYRATRRLGLITMVTDHDEYFCAMLKVFNTKHWLPTSILDDSERARIDNGPHTHYECLFGSGHKFQVLKL